MIASLASVGILLAWIPLAIALAARGERRLAPEVGSPAWRAAALAALVVVAICCLRPAATAVPCGLATIGLVAAAFVDARTGYLPDTITAPAAALTAVAALPRAPPATLSRASCCWSAASERSSAFRADD